MPEPMPTIPPFDPEALLHACGETSPGSSPDASEMAECRERWEEWRTRAACRIVPAPEGRFLAVWLEEAVEDAVDAAWERSPSHGYLLNALALALCMRTVREHLPEIAAAGCAPVPAASPALAGILTAAGLPARAGAALELGRRYAVVTPYPHVGTCSACALRASCTRRAHSGGGSDR